MIVFDIFERDCLFRLTRFVAMLFVFGLLLGIIVGGYFVGLYVCNSQNTPVTPSEVIYAIKPPKPALAANSEQDQSAASQDIMPSIKIPFVLQKYFDLENLKQLRSWLNEVPRDQRAEFLNEMAATVQEAEKSGVEPVDAINKFHELKMGALAMDKAAKDEQHMALLYYASAVAAAIIAIGQFSLILVLLAVERNTRKIV
jgi:hypothetical protein